ncbi:C40 family peptidase [Caballeronia sp. AZ10_KS36]|uniref:C40 family peptidase n=1 Tax=Caballeronia sp. AZ10_KS36 TaxID=2921757 RepID=UPI002028340C|nr:C40 family peptidase [Caballeronia sp. AZ10_KS36]
MRRIWLPLFVSVLLAACGSAPQQAARKPAVSASTTPRAYKPPSGFPNFVDHSVGREEISIQAMSLVGVPYRWGGNTPEAGFDCSGLVRYVVDRAASVNLPRTTAEMSGRGESVEPDEVAPGDLIFFNTTGRPHSHVGIYVGKLRFVNAPSTGGTVRLDYLTNPYWAKRFDGIRRVAPPKTAPTPFDAPTYVAGRGAWSEEATASAIAVERPSTSIGAAASAYAGRAPVSATTSGTSVASAYVRQKPAATTGADSFEPPPGSINAAQRQSSAAASASAYARQTPAAAASADAFEPPPASLSAAQRQSSAAASAYARQTPAAPASADVFEPPPASLSAAQRQSSAAASAYARQTPAAAASADAFEPPPASSSAAQRQSSAAASAYARKTPTVAASADAYEPPPASWSAAQRQSQTSSRRTTASPSQAPDPIRAAADAYEPPPPLSRAARQQAQAAMASQAAEPPVRAMRASTGSLTPPRAASNDDPIARFATGAD